MRGFIHVPKTGGTSIHNSGMWTNLGHTVVVDNKGLCNPIYAYKEHQKDYYENSVTHRSRIGGMKVFATVRNPYTWLLSWYDFMGGFEPWDPSKDQSERKLAQKGFDVFVRTILNRNDLWPNKRLLFFQLFAIPSGDLVVDHILHTENLDVEFGQATGFTGKPRRDQYGKRHGRGFTTAEFYDRFPGLAEEVFNTYSREFWLFGYSRDPSIEESDEKNALLSGNVVDMQKHVRYNWDTDTLQIMDKVIYADT